jgi:hypothetical protein
VYLPNTDGNVDGGGGESEGAGPSVITLHCNKANANLALSARPRA